MPLSNQGRPLAEETQPKRRKKSAMFKRRRSRTVRPSSCAFDCDVDARNYFHFVTAPEAPKRKEDEITNEGGEQQEGLHPRWKPRPQAPQQQPPPAFIDKMGAGLEAQANYFSYFVVIAILCIVFYLVFHNKQKVRCLRFVRRIQARMNLNQGGNYHRLNRLTNLQILASIWPKID